MRVKPLDCPHHRQRNQRSIETLVGVSMACQPIVTMPLFLRCEGWELRVPSNSCSGDQFIEILKPRSDTG
jgi:hypothetical protein